MNDKDIVSYLTSRSAYERWIEKWGPFQFRIRALGAVADGTISPADYFRFILPASMRPKHLNDKVNAWEERRAKEIMARYAGPDGSVMYYGHPFHLYTLENYRETLSIFLEVVTNDQYCAREFLKPGAVVMDVGANMGVFSVFAANLEPTAKIHAFEPVVKTMDLLARNTAAYPGVVPAKIGLGDEVKTETIYTDDTLLGGSTFEDSGFPENIYKMFNSSETAEITTMDKYVAENKLERVDFIKIDAEGYEGKIIRGAAETIRQFRPVIAMSAYHHAEDKVELPKLVKDICPDYVVELHRSFEEDFICYPKNLKK